MFCCVFIDEPQIDLESRTGVNDRASERNKTEGDTAVIMAAKDSVSKECELSRRKEELKIHSSKSIFEGLDKTREQGSFTVNKCKKERRKKRKRKRKNAIVDGKEISYLDKHSLYNDRSNETADREKNEEDILFAIFEQTGT